MVSLQPEIYVLLETWVDGERASGICTRIQQNWMIVGDFNDIRGNNEKAGGAQVCRRKCEIFNKRIDDYIFL